MTSYVESVLLIRQERFRREGTRERITRKMDDFIVNKDEDNFTFFGLSDAEEEPTYIGDDVHKETLSFQVDFFGAPTTLL